VNSSRRNALIMIVLAAAGAYAFHRGADNFWGVITCGLVAVWAAFSMLPVMDAGWRFKVGFVAVTFVAAFVALWPTLSVLDNVKVGAQARHGGRSAPPLAFRALHRRRGAVGRHLGHVEGRR